MATAAKGRAWTVTISQQRWLADVSWRFGVSSTEIADALIKHSHQQSTEVKKYIFRVLRCNHCGSGALRGGLKIDQELSLEVDVVVWIKNVREKCGHVSIDKTLRILLDYYMGKCLEDPELLTTLLCRPELEMVKPERRRAEALDAGKRLLRKALPRRDEDEGFAEGAADTPLEHQSPPAEAIPLALLQAALEELEAACELGGVEHAAPPVLPEADASSSTNVAADDPSAIAAKTVSVASSAAHYASSHRYRGLALCGLSRDADAAAAFEASLAASRRIVRNDSDGGSGIDAGHVGAWLSLAAAYARLGSHNRSMAVYRAAAQEHAPVDKTPAGQALRTSAQYDPRRRTAARVLVALGNALLDGCGSMGAHTIVAHIAAASSSLETGRLSAVGLTERFQPDSEGSESVSGADAEKAVTHFEAAASNNTPTGLMDSNAALAAFHTAEEILPQHVGALTGIGAAHWTLGDHVSADVAWAKAVTAFDADSARVFGHIVQYEYPLDPPLVSCLRQHLGTVRIIAPPPQAPRAPVYGSLTALRAWQKENEAREVEKENDDASAGGSEE